MHRVGSLEVDANFVDYATLCGGEFEGKVVEKSIRQRAGLRKRRRRFLLESSPQLAKTQVVRQQFLESQTFPRRQDGWL
jgi:hypothetical protein